MIPLRIAFDMDGKLADLSSAYSAIEDRIFGAEVIEHERPAPEAREEEQHVEEQGEQEAPEEPPVSELEARRKRAALVGRPWRASRPRLACHRGHP